MKLLVQQFLETKSFGDLALEHGVYASFSKSGHKWSLNYDQIEAKEDNPLAQECRGLILSQAGGNSLLSQAEMVNGKLCFDKIIPGATEVLAFPMKRFFNYGQGAAAEIDWDSPQLSILEKLDGTLCIVYWDYYTNNWCVATRSVPEADLTMDNGLFTFRTLFEKAVKDSLKVEFTEFTSWLRQDMTYCFELTTPYNRIVVQYNECSITLLAARFLASLQEVDLKDLFPVKYNKFPAVQAHTYTSISELVDWVSTLNPMEHEGIVARDGDKRVKIKNPAYVAYNRVRDVLSTSQRNCVELIFQEKDDDVIPFLPEEIVNNLQKIKLGIQLVIKEYDELYVAAKTAADQVAPGNKKEFALLVTKNKQYWSAPFFAMFDGKAANMKDFIAKNRKAGTWADGFLDKFLELSKVISVQE